MTKNLRLVSGIDHSHYIKGSKSPFYLYLELEAVKAATSEKRLPLNLGIVIDRSGSMSGKKIEYAREAVKFIINNLHSDDSVSLIQYDDVVDVLYPAANVGNKKTLIDIINKIQPRNSTNLSGGMMEGFNQVRKLKKDGQINRVLLLSDGLANVGVTRPEAIQQMAQKAYREHGISMSTFGIGGDYNEDLMNNLAEVAGGQQYFIGLPEDIPNIFATELQDLLAVVAQNVQLNIKYPESRIKLEKVMGFPHTEQNGNIEVRFQDIFSEDKKANLFKFVPQTELNENVSFDISVVFDEVLEEMQRMEINHTETLTVSLEAATVEKSANRNILEQVALFEANDQHKEVINVLEKGQYDIAREMAKQLITFLEAQLLHFPQSKELKTQLEAIQNIYNEIGEYRQMNVYQQSMSRKHYKSSHNYIRRKKRILYEQRQQMRDEEKRES